MTSNKKEKMLGMILLAIVGLNGAHSFIMSSIFEPLEVKRAKLKALLIKVDDTEFEYKRISHAQRHLSDQLQLSLPNEPAVAAAFYQEWLIEESILASIRNAQVTVGRAEGIGSAGHRIPFTVQAEMSIEQLGILMDQLKRQPLLHTIRHVTVTGSQTSHLESRYVVTIGIEALSLNDAEPRGALSSVENDASLDGATDIQLAKYLRQKNIFQAGYKPQPTQPVRKPVKLTTPVRPVLNYRFIAGIKIDGHSEAWLFESQSKQQKIVQVGMQIDINGTQYDVTGINQKELVLATPENVYTLQLGESVPLPESKQVTQR